MGSREHFCITVTFSLLQLFSQMFFIHMFISHFLSSLSIHFVSWPALSKSQ